MPALLQRTRLVPGFVWLLALPAMADEPARLTGAAAEEFLRSAKVVKTEEIGAGVTRPQRLTLTLGERTARAAWKTIDEYRPVMDFRDGRPPEIGFRDSWKHEIAAYELDKLLGLGMVPPAVKRKIRGRQGALSLWLEGAITETERRERGLKAPDLKEWNRQIHVIRLIRQLTHDIDFNNIGNILIEPEAGFRLWAIDHSRAFKTRRQLMVENDLVRFSRPVLARLRELTHAELSGALRSWLTKAQIAALVSRRDLILARAERLIAEQGEETVLYD